jgi:hypothetical protein
MNDDEIKSTEFERQLLALDQDKLEILFNKVISYYLDYEQTYPAVDKEACSTAISEVMINVESVVDPYDEDAA